MTMMALISLASILMSLFVILALLYLRWKEPDTPRPYKVIELNPKGHFISVYTMVKEAFTFSLYGQSTMWPSFTIT